MASKAGRKNRPQKLISQLGNMCGVCKKRVHTRVVNAFNQMICAECKERGR